MSKKLIFIILSLIAATSFFVLDEIFTEPVSDELLYKFKLGDAALGAEDYTDYIQTLGDVFESQNHQYFYSNGRYLVHVLVQIFDSLIPFWVYAIINGLVLLCTMFLLVTYTIRRSNLKLTPILWMVTILAFFYGFPVQFMSIPGALNYLWPMMYALGFLILWQRLKAPLANWVMVLVVIYALIVGWSQECFALPLSAAIFFSLIISRKSLNVKMLIAALILFIGAAILTFAPGNFVRIESSGRTSAFGYLVSVYAGIRLFAKMKIIWLLLATVIFAKFRGLKFREFIADNTIECLCLVFAILLGLAANTLPQSFTGIEFYSLILIYRIVDTLNLRLNSKILNVTALLLICAFFCHQIAVAQYRYKTMCFHKDIVKNYIESPDGLIVQPTINVPFIVRPYVPDWTRSIVPLWNNYTITVFYGSKEKPFKMLSQNEYDFVKNRTEQNRTEQNRTEQRVPGTLGCVELKSGYWCKLPPADTTVSVQFVLFTKTLQDNPTLVTKLKFKYLQKPEPDTLIKPLSDYEKFITPDSMVAIRVTPPLNRRVKQINILR